MWHNDKPHHLFTVLAIAIVIAAALTLLSFYTRKPLDNVPDVDGFVSGTVIAKRHVPAGESHPPGAPDVTFTTYEMWQVRVKGPHGETWVTVSREEWDSLRVGDRRH